MTAIYNCLTSCSEKVSAHKWNPKNWELTAKKTAEIGIAIFATCLTAILVAGLIVHYPQIAGAFFTALGIAGGVGLIAFIVGIVRHCQQQGIKVVEKEKIVYVASTPDTSKQNNLPEPAPLVEPTETPK